MLVRNEELHDLVKTMEDLERTWNNKFNYPWMFMNDKPFSEEFKRKTRAVTKAKCHYGMLNNAKESGVGNTALTKVKNRTDTQRALGRTKLDRSRVG